MTKVKIFIAITQLLLAKLENVDKFLSFCGLIS